MMRRIKLSVIAEKFPEIGIWLVDDKYNEPRMWVVQASIGKPLYEGKIPLSVGKESNFVETAIDGDSWVYVPQYDYRKYISPTYNQKFGRPKKDSSELIADERISLTLKIDLDLSDWVCNHKNKSRYINNLIRKDMEEQMNKED